MQSSSKNIAVIGAGLGGLAAASLLASSGHNVTIYERNNSPGGKMQEFRVEGFRFDTGPSLLTMPFIIRELFERCGENVDQYLDFREPEPLCRYVYPDGTVFDNYRDQKKSLGEISRFAPEDRLAYSRFLDHSKDLYRKTSDAFLFNPLFEIRDLKLLQFSDFLKIDAFSTVAKKVDQYFKSPYLRQFFKRFSTYNGSSPFQAPATLNVIPHVEINMGGFYIKGGLYRLAEALVSLSENAGARIQYQADVKQIEVSGGRVTGLRMASGQKIPADIVVSNSDASETLLKLIDKSSLSFLKKWKQKHLEPSCSGFVLLLGTNRQWSQLRHHNIFFSDNYPREFDQIFNKKQLPTDPTIYVTNTSLTDPEDAPENGSNLFILVNAPYLSENQDWKSERENYPDVIIDKLESSGLTGIRSSIQFRKVITPIEFYDKYRSNRGSIYGTSSNSRFSAFLRPRNKVSEIDGLYLTGGSTHPGGGIPLVLLSARHAVELISRDLNADGSALQSGL